MESKKPYLGKKIVEDALTQGVPVPKIKRTKRMEKTNKRRKKENESEQIR